MGRAHLPLLANNLFLNSLSLQVLPELTPTPPTSVCAVCVVPRPSSPPPLLPESAAGNRPVDSVLEPLSMIRSPPASTMTEEVLGVASFGNGWYG
jgi:hypothetical protein